MQRVKGPRKGSSPFRHVPLPSRAFCAPPHHARPFLASVTLAVFSASVLPSSLPDNTLIKDLVDHLLQEASPDHTTSPTELVVPFSVIPVTLCTWAGRTWPLTLRCWSMFPPQSVSLGCDLGQRLSLAQSSTRRAGYRVALARSLTEWPLASVLEEAVAAPCLEST